MKKFKQKKYDKELKTAKQKQLYLNIKHLEQLIDNPNLIEKSDMLIGLIAIMDWEPFSTIELDWKAVRQKKYELGKELIDLSFELGNMTKEVIIDQIITNNISQKYFPKSELQEKAYKELKELLYMQYECSYIKRELIEEELKKGVA